MPSIYVLNCQHRGDVPRQLYTESPLKVRNIVVIFAKLGDGRYAPHFGFNKV